MSGVQLATELRERVPGLPVLIITGYASLRPGDMDGLEVLAKPFAFTDLAARVAMLVGPVQEKIVLLPVRATKPVL